MWNTSVALAPFGGSWRCRAAESVQRYDVTFGRETRELPGVSERGTGRRGRGESELSGHFTPTTNHPIKIPRLHFPLLKWISQSVRGLSELSCMSINILFRGREQCLTRCRKKKRKKEEEKKCPSIHQSIMPSFFPPLPSLCWWGWDHDFILIGFLKSLSFCNFKGEMEVNVFD